MADTKLEKYLDARRKRQTAYRRRRNQKGQVRIAVWVPKHRADELRRIAQAICLEKPKAQKDPFGAPVIPVTGKTPGWSYIQSSRDEVWLHMILKANKAQWQNAIKKHPNTWRLRSDLVKELGLEKRVVATEQAGSKQAKKKVSKKTAARKKAAKNKSTKRAAETTKKQAKKPKSKT